MLAYAPVSLGLLEIKNNTGRTKATNCERFKFSKIKKQFADPLIEFGVKFPFQNTSPNREV